jgi:hypothetical protein
MCVSAAPAEFSGTILYVGRHTHPEHGPVEVLGYQNTAVNLSAGPNAMLLHLPAAEMTRANFLDTTATPDVLKDLVDALRPVSFGQPAGAATTRSAAAVEVFDHGVYTVVLAADPRDIPAALDRVPQHKRPRLSPELFTFYAETFPLYPVALCCFDNADARRAGPLLMWYPPIYSGRLTAPALDCHTGGVPDANGWVRPDHWVVVGLDEASGEWGTPVRYRSEPGPLAPFLPQRVIGREVSHGHLRNGDFVLSLDDARAGHIEGLARLTTAGERIPVSAPGAPPPSASPSAAPDAAGEQPAGRRWLRRTLITLVILVLAVLCGWFLIWGP